MDPRQISGAWKSGRDGRGVDDPLDIYYFLLFSRVTRLYT